MVRERAGLRDCISIVSRSLTNDQSGSGPWWSAPLVKGPPATTPSGPSANRAPMTTAATTATTAKTKPPDTLTQFRMAFRSMVEEG